MQIRTVILAGQLDRGVGDALEAAVLALGSDRIAEVGTRGEITPPAEVEIIDASGYTLTLGPIDCHTHLGGTSSPDYRTWVIEDDVRQAMMSMTQMRELTDFGVTTLRGISHNGIHLKWFIGHGSAPGLRSAAYPAPPRTNLADHPSATPVEQAKNRVLGSFTRSREAGVTIAVGSDSFSGVDALTAATFNGAQALRVSETTGSLTPGLSADLLIIDGDQLHNIRDLTQERMVCIRRGDQVWFNDLVDRPARPPLPRASTTASSQTTTVEQSSQMRSP